MRQSPRGRLRRRLKWGGLLSVVLLTIVFVATIRTYASLFGERGRWGLNVLVGARYAIIDVFHWQDAIDKPSKLLLQTVPVKRFGDIAFLCPVIASWRHADHSTGQLDGFHSYSFKFALWVPIALVLFPTTWLWWRDRRIAGHCPRCNYNLTGLPNSPCPECGHTPGASS